MSWKIIALIVLLTTALVFWFNSCSCDQWFNHGGCEWSETWLGGGQ